MINDKNFSLIKEKISSMPSEGVRVLIVKSGSLNLQEETVKEVIETLNRKSVVFVNLPFIIEDIEQFVRDRGYIDTVVISSKVENHQKIVDDIRSYFFMDMLIIFIEEDLTKEISIKTAKGMTVEIVELELLSSVEELTQYNIIKYMFSTPYLDADSESMEEYLNYIGINKLDLLYAVLNVKSIGMKRAEDTLLRLGLGKKIGERLVLTKQALFTILKEESEPINEDFIKENFMLFEIDRVNPIHKVESLTQDNLMVNSDFILSTKTEPFKKLNNAKVVYLGPTQEGFINLVDYLKEAV